MSHQNEVAAAGQPVSMTEIRMPVASLPTYRQWAGLDRGCSLTKILYITKEAFESPETPETRVFQCALFTNKDFEKGVSWLKREAYLPKERGSFHVTGAGGANFRKWISEQLEVEVEFQDEFLSQIRGSHFMVKYMPDEEICYPRSSAVDLTKCEKPEIIKTVHNAMREKLLSDGNQASQANKLPAIFAFLGSGGGITRINEDATGKVAGGVTFAGKTFLGLGKCLLGTADYDEICALAEQGNRRNTDTLASEVFTDGQLPQDTPLVCFGKLADSDKALKDYDRADLAHAHVSATALNIVTAIAMVSVNEKITQVYIGGNLVRADVIRKEIQFAKSLYAPDELNFHYLKTGHTGAIGAMITNQADQEKFFEAMKQQKL